MGLDDRVRKLEGSQPSEECPRCHDPQSVVYLRGEPPPEPCPRCGRVPPYVIEANTTTCRDLVERVLSGELPKPRQTTTEAPE